MRGTSQRQALLVEERVHQFGSSVGGEPEEILARRHSRAIVFFKDEREPTTEENRAAECLGRCHHCGAYFDQTLPDCPYCPPTAG